MSLKMSQIKIVRSSTGVLCAVAVGEQQGQPTRLYWKMQTSPGSASWIPWRSQDFSTDGVPGGITEFVIAPLPAPEFAGLILGGNNQIYSFTAGPGQWIAGQPTFMYGQALESGISGIAGRVNSVAVGNRRDGQILLFAVIDHNAYVLAGGQWRGVHAGLPPDKNSVRPRLNNNTELELLIRSNSSHSMWRSQAASADATTWSPFEELWPTQYDGFFLTPRRRPTYTPSPEFIGGELGLFVYSDGAGLSYSCRNGEAGNPWSTPERVGGGGPGSIQTSYCAEYNADETLDVFLVQSGSRVQHFRRPANRNLNQSRWEPLPTAPVAIVQIDVASNADGRLQLAGIGSDGNFWTTAQTAPSATTWSPWQLAQDASLGNAATQGS
jgi:hypothetical protein